MTKSTKALPRTMAFATLRFRGDRLDPDRVTEILGAQPTKAYRKGERYLSGPRAGYITGRTGVWVLATDSVVNSAELDRHLGYLVNLIFGRTDQAERLRQLRGLMSRDAIKADVSCFWRGGPGALPPVVPQDMIDSFHALPVEIETDFEADEI